jgi:transketolase
MCEDARIWVVTGDLGYKMWDQIKTDFPDRFINVGAAEQVMVGLGVGLALEGKVPFVYSITTFLLYRPFETIRNYIHREKIPVKLVGSGRDKDYVNDGFSHWAEEDKEVMKIFANIRSRWPETNEDIPALVEEMVNNDVPYYINLKK